jgi:hypothetical protein
MSKSNTLTLSQHKFLFGTANNCRSNKTCNDLYSLRDYIHKLDESLKELTKEKQIAVNKYAKLHNKDTNIVNNNETICLCNCNCIYCVMGKELNDCHNNLEGGY